MARILSEHFNNWEPRTVNYAFGRADTYYLSGESISSTVRFGPPIATHNSKCPTTTQEKPIVDTLRLKINNESRRPFFEDQYSWVKGPYEASGYSKVKYLGSGTLADDEVQSYPQRGGGDILLAPRDTSGVYEAIVLQNDADGYQDWFEDFESDATGEEVITFGNNTLYTAGLYGHLVNRWLYKVRPTDEFYDAIIAVKDGRGFGQQHFGDLQDIERFGTLQDELTYPTTAAEVLDENYPAFSGIRYQPPLPKSYRNPIVDSGLNVYQDVLFVNGASITYPEYWISKPHMCCSVFYSKRTIASSSLTIETAYFPVEFLTHLQGGDTVSAAGVSPLYWDQYGSGTGFQETILNSIEGGCAPGLMAQHQTFLKYRKTIVDYGGDGISREIYGTYRNHDFSYTNYFNTDAFDRDTGAPIPSALKDQYIEYFGSATLVYGNALAHSTGESIAGFADPRFNEMHIYSPETSGIVTYSNLSATTATLSDGTEIQLEGGEKYFNAYPDVPQPSGLGSNTLTLNFVNDTNLEDPLNYILATSLEGSGTGLNPIRVAYSRMIYATEDEWPGSNQIMIISERTSGAPGDLQTAAMGRFAILNSTKTQNPTTTGWLAPNNVSCSTKNHLTSGVWGQDGYGDAFGYAYASGSWGPDQAGKLFNSRLGSPFSIMGAMQNLTSYVPKGWNLTQSLTILGKDKEDVIAKLHTFLATHTWDQYIYAEDELPDVVLNYEHPLKAGNIN
jgi:hypothetical protein